MQFGVKLEVNAVLKSLNKLQYEIVPIAASRALNKTLTTVSAEAARQIKADLGGLKIREIKAQFKKLLSRPRALTVTLIATGKRIPVIKLDPHAMQTGTGVTYHTGKTVHEIPQAFLATVKNGHYGVFTRRGKSRLPISEKFGASIPKVFLNAAVQDAMRKIAVIRWSKVFMQELDYELRKYR